MKNLFLLLFAFTTSLTGLSAQCQPTVLCPADTSLTTCDLSNNDTLLWNVPYWWDNDIFSHNTSWRFIDQDHVFSDPLNPFTTVFPDTIHHFTELAIGTTLKSILLTGVKVGDVNNSVQVKNENHSCQNVSIEDTGDLQSGEIRDISLYLEEFGDFCSFQMGILFDPNAIEILNVDSDLPEFTIGSYHSPSAGRLNLSWYTPMPYIGSKHQRLVTLRVKALQNTAVSAVFQGINGIIPEVSTCDGLSKCLQLDFLSPAKVCITDCMDNELEGVGILVTDNDGLELVQLTNPTGCITLPADIAVGTALKVCPIEDDNHMSTSDIISFVERVSQHISGAQIFTSPYHWVAADINRDHVIDNLDITYMQNIVSGIILEMPVNSFWRFIPKDFVFQNPANPLEFPIPECINIDSLSNELTYEFIGIQLGKFPPMCDDMVSNDEAAQYTLQVQPPQPNPTNAGVSIAVNSDTWKPLKVSIIDLTGRVMYENVSESKSGAQVLEIPESAFPSTGMYIWQVSDGDYLVSGKVFRLRD